LKRKTLEEKPWKKRQQQKRIEVTNLVFNKTIESEIFKKISKELEYLMF
jgi:hypothetical protein